MSKQPNILLLMTDQHRHDGLGSVNPVVQTPNLDALANRGVRFTQAVCNAPMCVPSRYSMMTGLYGCQNGVKHNTQMVTHDEIMPASTLAEQLQSAGYQTAGIGKTHWYIGSRIMPDDGIVGSKRGFDARSLARKSEPGNYEPDSIFMADDKPEWFDRVMAEKKPAGPGGETVTGYVGHASDIPSDQMLEGWLASQACEFLDNGRDEDKPFFLYVSMDYPHPGFHVPREFEEMYDINDIPDLPPPDTIPDGHQSGCLEDRWPKMNEDQRRMSHLRYYALCTYVDRMIGQVLQKLEDIGELENTFVMFTSDHGDMMGDRGRVSKYCLYDGSVRVPMICAGAGVTQRNAIDDRPVELVDVLPTLLDAAGQEASDTLPGVSLLSDFTRLGSFSEMHGRGYEEYQTAPAVMFRTNEWKIILSQPGEIGNAHLNYNDFKGELYNLSNDPLELVNLYDKPEHLPVRDELTRHLLLHVMSSLGKFPFQTARTKIKVTGPATKPPVSSW